MARVIGLSLQLKGATVAIENTKDLRKTLILVRKELSTLKSTDPGFEEQSKNLKALEDVAREFRLEINKTGQQGYYRQLSAQLEQLRNDYKKLTEEELKSAKGRELEQKIARLSKELIDLDKRMGLYQRTIGNYRAGLASVKDILTFGLATGGFVKAIELVSEALNKAFQNTVEFSRQLSTIREVSGASVGDMSLLQAEILRVGANSEFTSQEIGQLAIEYAKLGFTAQEINDVLEATTDIATLAGEDLAQTASLVGSVLNIFGLQTTEAAAAGDVLAGVFNRTALDLKRFETGISIVGPAAAAVGVDLQTTAGLLGILADNSIDASTAGTSLRNIFIETANSGKSLKDAFDLILNSQNQLGTANALFGKDASVVAVTLANQREELTKLIDELYTVEGASKAAAERMRKDLKGAVDELQGASETLGITIGLLVEKPIAAFIRSIAAAIGNVAEWIQGLGTANQILNRVTDTFARLLPFIVAVTTAIAIQNRTVLLSAIAQTRALVVTRAVTLATRAWAIAQGILNVIMTANPIGLVITAIGAVVSVILLAINGTSKFSKALRGLFAVAYEVASLLLSIYNPIEFAKNVLNFGKNIGKAFKAGYASENVDQALDSINNSYQTKAGLTEEAYTKKVAEEARKRTELRQAELNKAAQLQAEAAQRERAEGEAYLKANEKTLASLGFSIKPGESFLDKSLKVDLGILRANTKKATDTINKQLSQVDNLTGDKFDLNRTKARADRTFTPFDYADSAKEGLARMREELGRLESQIQDNILAGKPYTEELKNYFKLTTDITNTEKAWKAILEARASSLGQAQTSLKAYSESVKELQDQLNEAEAVDAATIIPKLDIAQKQLEEAENAIKRIQRAASSANFTAVLESDLQPEFDSVNKARELAEKEARARISVEKELQEELRAIQLTADIQTLEIRKKLFTEGSSEFLKIENELIAKRQELGTINPDALRKESEARVRANKRVLELKAKDDSVYNAQKEVIELSLEAFLIQERLKGFKGSLEGELDLRIAHAEAIRDLVEAQQNAANAAAEANSNLFSEEAQRQLNDLSLWLDVAQQAAEAASGFIKSVFERQRAESDAYYDNLIEKAAGNKAEIERLEAEKAKKSQELRRREFEQRKKFEIAAASIAYAQGVINILTASSLIPQPAREIYKAAQVGILTIEYATQLNKIKNEGRESETLFAEGGYTGKGKGQRDSTGHRPVGIVHEDEYVMPKRVLLTPQGSALAAAAERMRLGDYAIYRTYATGGFVVPASTGTPSAYSQRATSVALFSDQQVQVLATSIADAVGPVIEEAIANGIDDALTDLERLQRLKLITG